MEKRNNMIYNSGSRKYCWDLFIKVLLFIQFYYYDYIYLFK